jgi:putative resolvase
VVLDAGEVDDDLVRDMVEVLTSLCARLYGRRSARNRALEAVGWRSAMSGLGRLSVVGGMMAVMDELRGRLPI